ncbi:MAG: glyoxalase [Chloroflexota bacterium]|nr:glyoxalase [Chloroflexota bacterium]
MSDASGATGREESIVNVLFVAGFGPITRDQTASLALYRDLLGLPLESEDDAYWHTDNVPGVKAFALWPQAQAAESCFGTDTWPPDLPIPQAWLEFDVDDVEAASAELVGQGYTLLIRAKTEPRGQTVTRLLGPEGLLVGLTVTPWMRAANAVIPSP